MHSNRKRFLAGLRPVVRRELRESARRRVNHRLRFWSGSAGALLLWMVVATSRSPVAQVGSRLLGSLHTLLLGLILLIVPGLMADSIAREQRDGTLGLLFLTPLSAGGVVAGKAITQGLRAFSLWLAVLPILIIPFLTGGVNWFDALSAVTLEFSAAVLSLAAGLLASTFARERNAAFLLALILAALFLFLYSLIFGFLLFGLWRGLGFITSRDGIELIGVTFQLMTGLLDVRGGYGWSMLVTVSPRLADIWKGLCLASPFIALLIFYGVARFVSGRIERSWMDRPPTLSQIERFRRFCTPLFRRRFQRTMRRSLDRNPIAWLQLYSWKARVAKWGLCLGFLAFVWAAIFLGLSTRVVFQTVLAVFAGIYTFAGVNSFLEEKRSGALELLLVTPLSVNRLIFGRVCGLWEQFLPAVLIAGWSYFVSTGPDFFSDFAPVMVIVAILVACVFLTLPVFATYFALRVKNLIVAGVLTWVALGIPLGFAFTANAFLADFSPERDYLTGICWGGGLVLSYSTFGLLACFLLRHSLSRRIYSF